MEQSKNKVTKEKAPGRVAQGKKIGGWNKKNKDDLHGASALVQVNASDQDNLSNSNKQVDASEQDNLIKSEASKIFYGAGIVTIILAIGTGIYFLKKQNTLPVVPAKRPPQDMVSEDFFKMR